MNDPTAMDLTGALLVAMPGMKDLRFDRSVIYICAYSAVSYTHLTLPTKA